MTMTQEAKEARRKYKREWNHKNADKVKAYQANYWQRKAEEVREPATAEDDPERGV